jgi:hypothetical protein
MLQSYDDLSSPGLKALGFSGHSNKPQPPIRQKVAKPDLSYFDKNIAHLKDIQKIVVDERKEKEEMRRIKIQEKIDGLVIEQREKDPNIKHMLNTNFSQLTKGKLPHVTYAITAGKWQRDSLILSNDFDAHRAYNIAHALESAIMIQFLDKELAELDHEDEVEKLKDAFENQKALHKLNCQRHQKKKDILSFKSGLSLAFAGIGAWLFFRQKR